MPRQQSRLRDIKETIRLTIAEYEPRVVVTDVQFVGDGENRYGKGSVTRATDNNQLNIEIKYKVPPATEVFDYTLKVKRVRQMAKNINISELDLTNYNSGKTGRCEKREWSINNGLTWDGITNDEKLDCNNYQLKQHLYCVSLQ